MTTRLQGYDAIMQYNRGRLFSLPGEEEEEGYNARRERVLLGD